MKELKFINPNLNLAELPVFEQLSDEELTRQANKHSRKEPREGYECPECGNYEQIYVYEKGVFAYTRDCVCKRKRNSLARARRAGLTDLLKRCTFDTFQTEQKWQQIAKQTVQAFVDDNKRGWLLLSGQSGCGKTHLCTAAVGAFIERGQDVHVMRWVNDSTMLKGLSSDTYEREKRLNAFKRAPVLLIDDLFKTQSNEKPTSADVRLAYDLLNYRYENRDLITMLSTERTVSELKQIDEATGGRIYEMAQGYCLEIGGGEKNWRFHQQ